jgi:hypothetical protein
VAALSFDFLRAAARVRTPLHVRLLLAGKRAAAFTGCFADGAAKAGVTLAKTATVRHASQWAGCHGGRPTADKVAVFALKATKAQLKRNAAAGCNVAAAASDIRAALVGGESRSAVSRCAVLRCVRECRAAHDTLAARVEQSNKDMLSDRARDAREVATDCRRELSARVALSETDLAMLRARVRHRDGKDYSRRKLYAEAAAARRALLGSQAVATALPLLPPAPSPDAAAAWFERWKLRRYAARRAADHVEDARRALVAACGHDRCIVAGIRGGAPVDAEDHPAKKQQRVGQAGASLYAAEACIELAARTWPPSTSEVIAAGQQQQQRWQEVRGVEVGVVTGERCLLTSRPPASSDCVRRTPLKIHERLTCQGLWQTQPPPPI